MKKETMILEFATECEDYEDTKTVITSRVIKVVKWAYGFSTINSMRELLGCLSYEIMSSQNMEDSNDTLHMKIKTVSDKFGDKYSAYICIPREILQLKVQKKFFPNRFVSIDSRKLLT